MKSRAQKGFSLIELLIVVVVILIFAAIAVPALLRSRMAANETSAVASMREINNAQVTYMSTYSVGYAESLADLGPTTGGEGVSSSAAGLLDEVLGCASEPCMKSGYTFSISGDNTDFISVSVPTDVGRTGQRGFFSDSSCVIRFDPTGAAPTATNDAIQ
jgi:type IV pilus assembly protein PilA